MLTFLKLCEEFNRWNVNFVGKERFQRFNNLVKHGRVFYIEIVTGRYTISVTDFGAVFLNIR